MLFCRQPQPGGYEEALFRIFAINPVEGSFNDFAAKLSIKTGFDKIAGMETVFSGYFLGLLNLLRKLDKAKKKQSESHLPIRITPAPVCDDDCVFDFEFDLDAVNVSTYACMVVKLLNGLIQICRLQTCRLCTYPNTEQLIELKKELARL